MKKFAILFAATSVLVLSGCSNTPEKAAEAHFKDTIKAHSGLMTEAVKITKVSEEGGEAVVNVSADLKYNEQLTLVKENGKWVVK
ncbi:MAG: lipoprotein [Desulfobacteraceae bacterium]